MHRSDPRTLCAFFPTPEAVSDDEMFRLLQEWAAANFLMALPTPATHAILMVLMAGETVLRVHQTGEIAVTL